MGGRGRISGDDSWRPSGSRLVGWGWLGTPYAAASGGQLTCTRLIRVLHYFNHTGSLTLGRSPLAEVGAR
jgi:hypothetical protein